MDDELLELELDELELLELELELDFEELLELDVLLPPLEPDEPPLLGADEPPEPPPELAGLLPEGTALFEPLFEFDSLLPLPLDPLPLD